MSTIKLLEMKPEDYKKEGYNFMTFNVNLRDLTIVGEPKKRDLKACVGTSVLYKNRVCHVMASAIMCGRHKDRTEKWKVHLKLITNDPKDYVK